MASDSWTVGIIFPLAEVLGEKKEFKAIIHVFINDTLQMKNLSALDVGMTVIQIIQMH